MKFHYSTLLFAILVLISCEFEPSGEYFTVVKEPHHVPPVVVDLNVVTDTILIELYGTLTFEFQTADRKFHWIRFCIGNNCETYYSHTGSFVISAYNNVSFGAHDLASEVYTGTGSGSIADALGFEGFLYSKTWTLIVLESLKDGMKILSVKPDKGSLKLTWDKSEYINNIKGYEIYIKTPDFAHELIAEITNGNDTSCVLDNLKF